MTRHPSTVARRPLVAVTATIRADDGVARVRLPAAYLAVLERAGVTPCVLAPLTGSAASVADRVGQLLDVVDGLVLTGGEDVEPARYQATPSPHLGRTSAARDEMEIAALAAARARALPTLAICRGIQLVNAALGGTLIQDIPSERPDAANHDPDRPRDTRSHAIAVIPDSRTARALGATALDVNSVHHQAVNRPAPGLRITATAADGIIEGLETPADDPWWLVAVQWHPEEFVGDAGAPDHGLFRAFADAMTRTTDSEAVGRSGGRVRVGTT
jgi:putative glutamine amidotransferase